MEKRNEHLYRELPQVDEYLRSPAGRELLERHPRPLVLSALRNSLSALRSEIAGGAAPAPDRLLEQIHARVRNSLQQDARAALRPVINATGVILQTNLGRAPLSAEAAERMAAVARGYCNLEYDLEAGARGRRGEYVEHLLLRLVGCDSPERAAAVVNNCAAAVLLALNSIAEGGEVIVSRGELVEIGGGFRVPEILRKSGARLVEVGSTNRTRIDDYRAAITADTRAILRVHRSNFAMVGFTEQPSLQALIALGAEAGVAVMEDQGTGCVIDLAEYGIAAGSSFAASARSGLALVCASGDKLLGGAQCGLAIGAPVLITKMLNNPLYRAFRADKLTYAAMQSTLLAYLSGESESIPAVHMLGLSAESIRVRCEQWTHVLAESGLRAEVVATVNRIGGGTSPTVSLPSFAVAIGTPALGADELAAELRRLDPPVIGRIHDGRVLLDLRTVPEAADRHVLQALTAGIAKARMEHREDRQPQ